MEHQGAVPVDVQGVINPGWIRLAYHRIAPGFGVDDGARHFLVTAEQHEVALAVQGRLEFPGPVCAGHLQDLRVSHVNLHLAVVSPVGELGRNRQPPHFAVAAVHEHRIRTLRGSCHDVGCGVRACNSRRGTTNDPVTAPWCVPDGCLTAVHDVAPKVLIRPVGPTPNHTATAAYDRWLTVELAHVPDHLRPRAPIADVLPERVELEDAYVAGNVEPPVTAKRHARHASLEFLRAASRPSRNGPDPLPRFKGEDHRRLGLLVVLGVEDAPGPVQGHVSDGANRPPFIVDDDPPDGSVDLEDLLGAGSGSRQESSDGEEGRCAHVFAPSSRGLTPRATRVARFRSSAQVAAPRSGRLGVTTC